MNTEQTSENIFTYMKSLSFYKNLIQRFYNKKQAFLFRSFFHENVVLLFCAIQARKIVS